ITELTSTKVDITKTSEYNKTISTYESRITELTKKIDILTKNVSIKDKSEIQKITINYENKIASLNKKITELTSTKVDITNASEYKMAIADLQRQISELNHIKNLSRTKISQYKKKLSNFENTTILLNQKVEQLNEMKYSLTVRDEEIKYLKGRLFSCMHNNELLNKDLLENSEVVSKLSSNLIELKARFEALEKRIETLGSLSTFRNGGNSSLKTRIFTNMTAESNWSFSGIEESVESNGNNSSINTINNIASYTDENTDDISDIVTDNHSDNNTDDTDNNAENITSNGVSNGNHSQTSPKSDYFATGYPIS
ncbi:uncharacterized protein ASCRUDRAFT_6773, partial [Ascoidea rubescens DSM 1968]